MIFFPLTKILKVDNYSDWLDGDYMHEVPDIVEEMRIKEKRDYHQIIQENPLPNQNKVNTELKEIDLLEDVWFHVWRML